MGLFNWGGSKPEIKDEKEAFLAIIYAAIAADGVVEPEEMNALAVTLANKKSSVVLTYKTLSNELTKFTRRVELF